jgi:intracellular septation protein
MTEKTAEPEINWDELRPQLIKMGLEIAPLVVFFIANFRGEAILAGSPMLSEWFSGKPLIFATAVFMPVLTVSLLISWFIFKRVAIMPIVTLIGALIFGGLSIAYGDETLFMVKPTIVNTLFGVTLLGGLLFGQSLLKYVFGDVYKLMPEGWRKLTLNWGLFFLLLAVINEVLWRNFSSDIWVAFKVWGVMPLTVIFSISQLSLLNKYAPVNEPAHVPPIVVES